MDSFSPVTPQGGSIAALFTLVMVLSAGVFLIVAGLVTYVVLRFHGRPGDPDPPQVAGNKRIEIAWTAAPVILLAVLFVLTVQTMGTVEAEAPPDALRIRVVGFQWWWRYEYPDLGVVTANELRVPVGVPLRLELHSGDVIHSFWVPRFGWKKDATPGRTTDLTMRIDQEGIYDGACTEYCGTQHAWMRISVVAESRERFDAWVQQQRQPAATPAQGAAARGMQVFHQNTCVNCHAVRGTAASAEVGPDLTHFGSRTTLGAGVLENTADNLRRWLRDPHQIKPGVLMPGYNDLSADELDALVKYLRELR